MLQIVITGTNGLLGHETLKQLSGLNQYAVFALERDPQPAQHLPHIHYIKADLSQPDYIGKLPMQVDVVMHLAQSNHFRQFPDKANDIFSINCQATLQLLDYARQAGANKFIYLSTGGVYSSGRVPYEEKEANCFDSKAGFYATSKFIGEQLAQSYQALMDVLIFRPFFIYGPRQKKDMLIARLLHQIQSGQPVRLNGRDGIHINPIFVSDAATALISGITMKGSATLNLGGNEQVSLRQLCEQMGRLLNKEPLFEVNENETPNDLTGDTTLLKSLLYTPLLNLENGLTQMITHEK